MQRFVFCLMVMVLCTPVQAQYYERGNTVDDLVQGITWLRCSLGQRWNPDIEQCTGDAQRLNFDEIRQAIDQANAQLGGEWRLPTREELRSLICTRCAEDPDPEVDPEVGRPLPAMIDTETFPNTAAEPYWTSDKNWMAPRNRWSVNFMTGKSYARFFPEQRLAVRLVKDR